MPTTFRHTRGLKNRAISSVLLCMLFASGLVLQLNLVPNSGCYSNYAIGSISEDCRNIKQFWQYINLHVESWYKHVNKVRGREARNGDIRIRRIVNHALGWNQSMGHGDLFQLDSTNWFVPYHVQTREEGNIGRTYGWEYSGIADVRAGPDAKEIGNLRNKQLSQQELITYNNQGLRHLEQIGNEIRRHPSWRKGQMIRTTILYLLKVRVDHHRESIILPPSVIRGLVGLLLPSMIASFDLC